MYYSISMSTASNPLPDHELMDIKEKNRRESARLGLTGMLIFHRNTFIHCYEGESDKVQRMLASVSKDRRHKGLKGISEGRLSERQFREASMELRVLDKDPLFSSSELSADQVGIRKMVNDCFMQIN